MKNRIGFGIDVHQLVEGKSLIIGGVIIPFHKNIKAFSDGDILYHSIVDAILGSLSIGDIGQYFPSNNNKWKGADSQIFLEHANGLMIKKGYSINNIDSTVILQEPKLRPHILSMRKNIARLLNIDINQISIKATTTDKMGYIGNNEGIAATTIILLSK